MQTAPPRQAKLLPWIITCALFMENLDGTILTTAIPAIAHDFGVGPLQLKLALTAYLISLAIFIPASGWVAEAYGFRRVFCGALIAFVGGSLLCGLAQTLAQLVVARMVQGVGGAMMVPTARFLLMRSYPKDQLVRITNLITIPALIGPALGPLVGGALTTYAHWRFIFWLNLPVGALGLWAARRALPKDFGHVLRPLDVRGFALCGLGLCGLSFGVEALGEPFLSPLNQGMLWALSIALLCAYGVHAIGHPAPFLRLSLFAIPTFRVGMLASIASRLGVGGVPFLLPLLYQTALGYPPIKAGLITLPLSLGMLGMKWFITPLLRRFGFRRLLMVNSVLLGLAILQFAQVDQATPLPLMLLASLVYGALASIQFSCMNVLVYVDLKPEAMGDATSIFSTLQQFSMGLGVGFSALCVGRLWHGLGLPMVRAYHGTFVILALLTCASMGVFALLGTEAGAEASGHRRRQLAPQSF
jgi:EmrB/QacA subfamily drug resistance transporter